MSISVKCDRCENELDRRGGLAFSPPLGREHVRKYHLCIECWAKFLQWIANNKEQPWTTMTR